jgi:hypothetical protein
VHADPKACTFPLANPALDPGFVTVTVGTSQIPRDLSHRQGCDNANDGAAIRPF